VQRQPGLEGKKRRVGGDLKKRGKKKKGRRGREKEKSRRRPGACSLSLLRKEDRNLSMAREKPRKVM